MIPRNHRSGSAKLALLVTAAVLAGARGGDQVSGDLRQYEGRVDEAVSRGLAYLAGAQASDGAFSGDKGKISGVVSLAGMAFLAKGYTPGHAPYGDPINLCIDYVVRNQRKDGMLIGPGDNKNETGGMYSHTISTLFLSEVSGMLDAERQRRVSEALARAVRLILDAQQIPKEEQHRGGWRYEADSKDSDLSCSGWALMALRSAKLNGAPVPDKAIDDAVAYILGKHDANSGSFGYQNTTQYHVTLTGAALLCLELTGHHGDPACRRAGEHILNVLDELRGQDHAVYGLYYGAQATFQIGGQYWPRFAGWMYDNYLKEQKTDGSWEGGQGRIYSTAMMVLALTVPYRQLPIYQRDETVSEVAVER
jgi:hypothetical protein